MTTFAEALEKNVGDRLLSPFIRGPFKEISHP